MKKWFKFFGLSFFSNKISKEGAKRGYTNFFVGLVLALIFLWVGLVGGDMLPFGSHYDNSPDFKATVRAVLANPDENLRIDVKVNNERLIAKKQGGEYLEQLLVNTFESDTDKQNYSVNGYNVVIDMRPADTLAEIEAYCISNDGKNTKISYEEYLTLSEVARLNFNFELRYTGNALELTDQKVEEYKAYLGGLTAEIKQKAQTLLSDLEQNKITKEEYNREIYQLYFTNYYPPIVAYESSSKVPLLRNSYYHNYINKGAKTYIFIFDDNIAGSFKTKSGIEVVFYGFYSNTENGVLIKESEKQAQANMLADEFIKKAYSSITGLNFYAQAVNVFTLIPFIALMPMVVTLLAYSILKLRGVESIKTLGDTFKIIGSYQWFSALISTVFTIILAFFVKRNLISALPLVLFFVTLAIRSVIFAVSEARSYLKQLEEQERAQTEV